MIDCKFSNKKNRTQNSDQEIFYHKLFDSIPINIWILSCYITASNVQYESNLQAILSNMFLLCFFIDSLNKSISLLTK